MYLVNCIAPGLDRSEVRVQYGEVNGGVLIIAPRLVDKRGAGDVEALDTV